MNGKIMMIKRLKKVVNMACFYTSKPKGKKILLACMPKSGSTFTTQVIANLDGVEMVSLVNGYERREHELDIHRCIEHYNDTFIAQHHVRCSLPTTLLVQRFNLFPVFLTRNIFDTVISFRDHIRNEGQHTATAYFDEGVAGWDDARIENAIADLAIPWFLNFYVSWYLADQKLHVTYEELVNDEVAYFKKIVEYAGLKTSTSRIKCAIKATESQFTRKNIGVPGRGEGIDPEAREKIIKLSSYYDEINFNSIGITKIYK